MQYTFKSGVLYEDDTHEALAKMKSAVFGQAKKIYDTHENMLMTTDVHYFVDQDEDNGDIRNKEYVMMGSDKHLVAEEKTEYAQGYDPEAVGWPVCKMPKVDHAELTIDHRHFLLTMLNSQNYSLRDDHNTEVLTILHKGIAGGWTIRDDYGFRPDEICGLFAFCRYIEQENELLVV